MVRPTKYHPARVDAICDALRAGATIEHAAEAAGIHRDTVHEWRTRYPAFADRIKEAEGAGVLASLRVIRGAAEGGTWQAAAWLLERRYPDLYGRRPVIAMATATAPDARATAREVSAAIDAFLSDLGRVEAPGTADPPSSRTPPTTSTTPDVAPKASPVRATAAVLMTGGEGDGWDAF
jgi:hypothetical protein